jgi:16S rRNA (uracil1498-N3)-methyltransferase
MEYFYTPPSLVSGTHLAIEADEFSHLTHVMRKEPGDEICVVDGRGMAYDVVISEITARTALCSILAVHPMKHEPQRKVIVGVGLLKNSSNFDYLVEKTTEVGVTAIVPLLTVRTIPRHAKTERWQKIALAAMKQCGRSVLPAIRPLMAFADFLESTRTESSKYISHEKVESPALRNVEIGNNATVCLCIGPEGGFSHEEIEQARGAGYIAVSLGPRRLRTETAAIVAAAEILL